jgi:hypothetical protein
MNRNSSLLVTLLVAASILTGCAGSGATTGVGASPYQGAYQSTVTLDNAKTGTLVLDVAANATANGTLTVTAPSPNASLAPFTFTAGPISVSGNVNPDGSFSLTGTDPTSGGFNIGGNLPLNANGTGSLTVSAGGSTFTSTIGVSQGGGSGSLTFSNSTASINTAAFSANPFILMSTVNGDSAIVAVPSAQDNSRSFSVLLGSAATAGSTVALAGNANVNALYHEIAVDNVDWIATGGSLKIVSRTTNSFEIQFQNVVFTSQDATGSFTVNGTLKK